MVKQFKYIFMQYFYRNIGKINIISFQRKFAIFYETGIIGRKYFFKLILKLKHFGLFQNIILVIHAS